MKVIATSPTFKGKCEQAHRIVLTYWPENNKPFTTHWQNVDEEKSFYWGNYFSSLDQAWDNFSERVRVYIAQYGHNVQLPTQEAAVEH